jgi:AraC-like DNA-binding protein
MYLRGESGREKWHASAIAPRHRHDHRYAAIVLSGSYEECGSAGRFRVGPGDVLLHDRFDAHLDRFGRDGATIMNLADAGRCLRTGKVGRVSDPDAIARTAETDPRSARIQLDEQLTSAARSPEDWPDLLAADILCDPGLCIGAWAAAHDLAPETVSRGFRSVFGLTPAGFRVEARAHRALAAIVAGTEPLAAIAASCGFADQAHMSRATRTLTGQTPIYWRRRSSSFKTAANRAGYIAA